MNELLAIFYFCFITYEIEEKKKYAESDAYWCFLYLVNTLSSMFLFTEKFKGHPLKRTLTRFSDELELALPEISQSLKSMNIMPEFYAYRWIL